MNLIEHFEVMATTKNNIRVECSNGLNIPETKPQPQRFYFNTGVRPERVSNFPYEYHKKIGNVIRGTLCIPFDCNDVPENATLMYLCDNSKLHDNVPNIIVREVVGGNMSSKYAYFTVPL